MSTIVKTGWLNDENGDKFAPKTLISQVQTNSGTLLEDKIQADVDAAKSYADNKFLSKEKGGTVKGNLIVAGDLTVNGTTYSKDHETIKVEDNLLVLNSNKEDVSDVLSGIAINKDADLAYGIVYDLIGDTVKLGEGSIGETGEFTFNEGEGRPLVIRDDSNNLIDGHFLKWDATENKLVDGGVSYDGIKSYIDTNIVKASNLAETAISLTMVNNTEYHCTNPVESLTIEAFEAGSEGVCEQWSILFATAENTSITVPETVKWALADPIFDGNKTYWLSFIPFGANYLGVWTVMA